MKKLVSLLLIFACFAAPLAGTYGLVYCYRMDGRIEVEYAINGSCEVASPKSNSSNENQVFASIQSAYCGPCVDVPIALSHYDARLHLVTTKTNRTSLDTICFIALASTEKIEFNTSIFSPSYLSHSSLSLASLRTIVLRV